MAPKPCLPLNPAHEQARLVKRAYFYRVTSASNSGWFADLAERTEVGSFHPAWCLGSGWGCFWYR